MKPNNKLLKEELIRSKKLMGIVENITDEREMGKKVEKEHDPTYENIKKYYEKHGDFPKKELVFMWIANDHLEEFNDYYTRLNKMEKDAKSGVPVNDKIEKKSKDNNKNDK